MAYSMKQLHRMYQEIAIKGELGNKNCHASSNNGSEKKY